MSGNLKAQLELSADASGVEAGVGMLLRGPGVYLMCIDLGDVFPSEIIK